MVIIIQRNKKKQIKAQKVTYLKEYFPISVEHEDATHSVISYQNMPVTPVHGHVDGLLEGVVGEVLQSLPGRGHFRDVFAPPVHHRQTIVRNGYTYNTIIGTDNCY